MKRRVTPIAQAIQPMLEAQHVDALRGCFSALRGGGRAHQSAALERGDRERPPVARASCSATTLRPRSLCCRPKKAQTASSARTSRRFAASERYFKLRRQLGIAIDQN
jgi:hypothetical protein